MSGALSAAHYQFLKEGLNVAKKTAKSSTPRKSRSKLWTTLVHARFHFDELVAIILLQLYGEKLFPGISSKRTKVEIVSNPGALNSVKELNHRRICIGHGGGWFDDHVIRGRVTSAAELVAEKIGISESHPVRRLLDQVVRCDNDSGVDELHIASIIKRLHKHYPDNPEIVLDRVSQIIRDLLEEEQAYEEVYQNLKFARHRFLLKDSGRQIRVAVARSDNAYASTVCRNKSAQLVLMIQSKGNMQIISDEKAGIELSGVARLVRMAELAKRNRRFKFPGAYLRSPGKLKECPQWFFFSKRGQFLLNGSSQSSPGVEATALNPREVLRAIEVGACERNAYREPGRISQLKDRIAERRVAPNPEEIARLAMEKDEEPVATH